MTTAFGALEDGELMVRVADGDVSAFEEIYDRYSSQVFGLALRVTGRLRAAEETSQDVFVGLWRKAVSYDPHRGALRTWLLSMARNRSIDWMRRESRNDRVLEIDEVMIASIEAPERTELEVASREECREARQLLLSLPPEQRRVIELSYFHGLTQPEIAARLHVPLGTVKGRQRLALTKMHRELTSPPVLAAAGAQR